MIAFMQKLLVEGKYKTTIKNSSIQLIEKGTMKINITELQGNGLAIRFDNETKDKFHPSVITKKGGNYRKMCDYLILMPYEDVMEVYFIELKKTIRAKDNSVLGKACDQILYTIPLWDYLESMIKTHHHKKSPIIRKHYVVIADRASEKTIKQQTKYEQPKLYNHRGEDFRLIYSLKKGIPLEFLRC